VPQAAALQEETGVLVVVAVSVCLESLLLERVTLTVKSPYILETRMGHVEAAALGAKEKQV
jgi:hypothetical protein